VFCFLFTAAAPSKRILSLKDPSAKMSKSAVDPASRILLTDTAAKIAAKVRAAVTDSIVSGVTYDPVARPGTSNLLSILAACSEENVDTVAASCAGMSHGELKAKVAEAVEQLVAGPRAEFQRIRAEVGYLDEVAREGAAKARELSAQTMIQVRERVGLS
jgi:tryptophanyl-tRNA synthetase